VIYLTGRVLTRNISSSAIAVRQKAYVLSAFGCRFIWRRLWVNRVRAGRWVTVYIHKLLSLWYNCSRWLKCWPRSS